MNYQVNTEKCTQLSRATWESTKCTHLTRISTFAVRHSCLSSDHPPSLPSLISCNPSVIFTSKLNFFFRAKCYIYCSIYAFLKHLMYKTGLFILGSGLSFIASLTKFLSVTSLTPFFSHALWFYCAILHSMLIFRNIYALLWWR